MKLLRGVEVEDVVKTGDGALGQVTRGADVRAGLATVLIVITVTKQFLCQF